MKCRYDGDGVWSGRCVGTKEVDPCPGHEKCERFTSEYVTNADRIRAMSDEDLAWELMTWRIETAAQYHGVQSDYPNTQKTILEWLKQPAEEDE